MKSNVTSDTLPLIRKIVRLSFTLLVALGVCTNLSAQGERLKRGLSLLNASQPMEAEQVFRAIGPDDPDYLPAQSNLGFLLLQRAALTGAEQAFRNVLNRQPGLAPARFGLGVTLVREGKPSEGARELGKILTDPEVGLKAQVQWVQSIFYAGETERAFRETQKLAQRNPSAVEFQRLLGYFHEIRGETGAALQAYLKSVELDPKDLAAYFSLIAIYRSSHDWENAYRWVQAGLAVDRNQPLLYEDLAAIYEKLGRASDARTARAEAAKTYEADVLYTRAARSRSAGSEAEAENLLRESVARNPRLTNAWTDLGDLLERQNRHGEAKQAYQNALEASPRDPHAILGMVTALQKEGKDEEAAHYFEIASAGGQLEPDLLAAKASGLLQQGKAEEATAAMLNAVAKLPDDPNLLSYLGYLQQSAGRNAEALDSFTKALRLNPAQIDALAGRGRLMLDQGNAAEAISTYRLARKLSPSNIQILKGLMQAYQKAGDAASAESTCRACLKLDSNDLDCRQQLAWLRLDSLDYKEASAQYKFLLDHGRETKDVLDGLSFSQMRRGVYSQAIDLANISIRKFGPDARVYSNLGFLHRCVGDLAAAAADYKNAVNLTPESADANEDLGFTFYLKRDFAAAVGPLETAVRLKPGWGMAHFNLAMVYWNLNQYHLALSQARLAQQLGVRDAGRVVRTLEAYLDRR